jgi:hypothetical protein
MGSLLPDVFQIRFTLPACRSRSFAAWLIDGSTRASAEAPEMLERSESRNFEVYRSAKKD